MYAHVVVGNVTRSAADFVDQGSLACADRDPRANAIAVGGVSYRFERDPVIRIADLIHQQAGLGVHIAYDYGDAAIVPEIADGKASGRRGGCNACARRV